MADEGMRPLYAVLQLSPNASPEEVKQAYRRLALQHHPDKCRGSPEEVAQAETLFARIALAYEILGDEQRRRRYDLTGELPQNDAAAGRSAQETFLAEYMKAAPRTARPASQADYSLHSLENYEILEVDGKDVPRYMRGIVARGLGYLAAVLEGMEKMEVVLLRHFVMDQMYALLAYTPPLDAHAFGGDRGYVITYYDAPLQAGIQPSWSDQNGPTGGFSASRKGALSELRVIDGETVERRRLAALEWVAPPSGSSGAAAVAPNVERPNVPGVGLSEERLHEAAKILAKREADLGSFTGARLRKELEEMLGLEAGGLKSFGTSQLMGIVLSACDEVEAEDEGSGNKPVDVGPGRSQSEGPTVGPGQQAMVSSGSPSSREKNAGPLSSEPCCSGIGPFLRLFGRL